MALKDEIEKWNTVQSSFTSPILGLCTSFSCFYSKSNNISEQHHPVLNAWCLRQHLRSLFLEDLGFGGKLGFWWWWIFFKFHFYYSLFSLPLPPDLSQSSDFVRSRCPDGSEVPKMEDALLCLHRGSESSAQLTNTTLKRFLFL